MCVFILMLNTCKTYLLAAALQMIDVSLKCYYNGKMHTLGQIFLSIDKCNKCCCKPKGEVECTKKKCPPPTPSNNKTF